MRLLPCPRAFTLLLLLLCLFCSAFTTVAQRNLVNSRTTSFYTYVYKLTDAEARVLYKKGINQVKPAYFHTVTDSFLTGKSYSYNYRNLKLGHYLFTYASGLNLEYELKTQT